MAWAGDEWGQQSALAFQLLRLKAVCVLGLGVIEFQQQRARGLAFFMVLDCGLDKEAFHLSVRVASHMLLGQNGALGSQGNIVMEPRGELLWPEHRQTESCSLLREGCAVKDVVGKTTPDQSSHGW